jgi:hypothetical protein
MIEESLCDVDMEIRACAQAVFDVSRPSSKWMDDVMFWRGQVFLSHPTDPTQNVLHGCVVRLLNPTHQPSVPQTIPSAPAGSWWPQRFIAIGGMNCAAKNDHQFAEIPTLPGLF